MSAGGLSTHSFLYEIWHAFNQSCNEVIVVSYAHGVSVFGEDLGREVLPPKPPSTDSTTRTPPRRSKIWQYTGILVDRLG